MYQVHPIDRATIDDWPIREAGLPTRVVNSVEAADIRRVGELRGWSDAAFLRLRSLGRISLGHIHTFLATCDDVERGRQRFANLREVLHLFLDGPQFAVLSARYGFDRTDLVASGNRVTLQDIGNQTQRTRERIRQVEENGKLRLGSRLAAVCLQPFLDHIRTFIGDRSKAVSCEETRLLWDDPAFDGLNPCGMLTLLSDLYAEHILLHNGFFTLLDASALREVEQKALDALRTSPTPLTVAAMTGGTAGRTHDEHEDRAVTIIMDHCPVVGATNDGRYFLFSSSVQPILEEILTALSRPAHYRVVTRTYNEIVKPRSRKGAGYILDMLNLNPRCMRVDRGMYQLTSF